MFNKDELNQLYRYAISLSSHDDMAYDLVHTAIERYIKKASKPIENPLAYLKTIIRNVFFDIERRKKIIPIISTNNEEILYIEPVNEDSMEDILFNQQQVQQLLSYLNSEENELLYLWAVEEHTVSEIAVIYNKPRGTILSKLHRLKKRIRTSFQENNDDTDNFVKTTSYE